jgi:flagellar biosynthetic protein FliR
MVYPLTLQSIHVFSLVFTRIVAIVAFLPIFGSLNVPSKIKVALSLVLALIIYPLVQPGVDLSVTEVGLPLFAVSAVKEIFIGILIGFTASFIYAAIQFAGRIVDLQMGFAFVQMVDPLTSARVTTMGQLKMVLFTIMILLVNGHYFFIIAMKKSFDTIPLLQVSLLNAGVITLLTTMSAEIFVSAVKLAAPVLATLLLVSVALGVIARTVPQVNIFFVGLPVKIFIGMAVTFTALPILATVFRQIFTRILEQIWQLLYVLA